MIDLRNNELIKEDCAINWLIKDKIFARNKYKFEKYGIYKLLVRKAKPVENDIYSSTWKYNRYMVVKIIDKKAKNKELEELAEYLKIPVIIKTNHIELTLDRDYNVFQGYAEIDNENCDITVETDETDREKATKALERLKKNEDNLKELDNKLRNFAADDMLENAIDWQSERDKEEQEEELTREKFIEKMSLCGFEFLQDGCIIAYYDDGDMFWGHKIVVEMDEDNNCNEAYIAG